MGQSAGGQSVIFHLISPLSYGLFNRAIVQSLTPLGKLNNYYRTAEEDEAWGAK